jgi:hypothetical protein
MNQRKEATAQKSLPETTKEFDALLADRLENVLAPDTKREIQLEAALTELRARGPRGKETDADDVRHDGSDGAYDIEQEESRATADLDDTALRAAMIAEDEPTVTLARIAFRDGDVLEFLAVPGDGEISLVYSGDDDRRCSAVFGELLSPLRLYSSLAPPDAPLPWLLAAVDKQPDRRALVGDRALCDSVEHALPAASDTIRLRVPGAPGGWAIEDDYAIGGFCGVNGEQEWRSGFCEGPEPLGPIGLPNVVKCESDLHEDLTHTSFKKGWWRRRRAAMGLCAPCGSPVRITIQKRKLVGFKWKWKAAAVRVVGPANFWRGAVTWSILFRRRWRIRYQREGAIGGFRAWSLFAQDLFFPEGA